MGRINPEIFKIEKTLRFHVIFCHSLDKIKEDPVNHGYYIMFDTIPNLKWKDGEYNLEYLEFLGN